MKACCERMAFDLAQVCEQHECRFECPDALIFRSDDGRTFGLIIHDGSSSFITIQHCPWCGAGLGDSE